MTRFVFAKGILRLIIIFIYKFTSSTTSFMYDLLLVTQLSLLKVQYTTKLKSISQKHHIKTTSLSISIDIVNWRWADHCQCQVPSKLASIKWEAQIRLSLQPVKLSYNENEPPFWRIESGTWFRRGDRLLLWSLCELLFIFYIFFKPPRNYYFLPFS